MGYVTVLNAFTDEARRLHLLPEISPGGGATPTAPVTPPAVVESERGDLSDSSLDVPESQDAPQVLNAHEVLGIIIGCCASRKAKIQEARACLLERLAAMASDTLNDASDIRFVTIALSAMTPAILPSMFDAGAAALLAALRTSFLSNNTALMIGRYLAGRIVHHLDA